MNWLRRLARRVRTAIGGSRPAIGDVDFNHWHTRAVHAAADRRWDDALRAIEEARQIEEMVLEAGPAVEPDGCPHCGERLAADAPVDGLGPPGAGDMGVCAYCGGLVIYEDGRRRVPTDAEREELLRDPMVLALTTSIRRKPLTREQKSASLSYLLGWTDALFWAVAKPEEYVGLADEVVSDQKSGVRRVCFLASEIFDELGADPLRWLDEVPRDRLMELSSRPPA